MLESEEEVRYCQIRCNTDSGKRQDKFNKCLAYKTSRMGGQIERRREEGPGVIPSFLIC